MRRRRWTSGAQVTTRVRVDRRAPCFHQEGCLDEDRRRAIKDGILDSVGDLRADEGMGDLFQLTSTVGVRDDYLTKCWAVEVAV